MAATLQEILAPEVVRRVLRRCVVPRVTNMTYRVIEPMRGADGKILSVHEAYNELMEAIMSQLDIPSHMIG